MTKQFRIINLDIYIGNASNPPMLIAEMAQMKTENLPGSPFFAIIF